MKNANRLLDMTGMTFGRLTVIGHGGIHVHPKGTRSHLWECKCSCGLISKKTRSNLLSGNCNSCGCLAKELLAKRRRTHGESQGRTRSREYGIYLAMKQRCRNSEQKSFSHYGGRGITICEKWMKSFKSFLDDMGRCPSPDHSIDRVDNNGNYEPGNCRWATQTEQMRNQAKNRILEFNGLSKCVAEWAEITGLHVNTIKFRLRSGWPIEEVLTIPIQKPKFKSARQHDS